MKKLTRFKLTPGTFPQLTAAFEDLDIALHASDPTDSSWACIGIDPDSAIIADNGMRFNIVTAKRQLSRATIKDRAQALAAKIEENTGRKPGKKEMRQLMDDAETELLPRAFVVRRVGQCIVTAQDEMWLSTPTDATLTLMVEMLRLHDIAAKIDNDDFPYGRFLHTQVIDALDDMDGGNIGTFLALKNHNSGAKMRFDKVPLREEMEKFIRDGYEVAHVTIVDGDEASFRIDDKGRFSHIDIGALLTGDSDEANVWLTITEYSRLFHKWLKA